MNNIIAFIESAADLDIVNPYTGDTVATVYFIRGGRRRPTHNYADVLAANPHTPLVAYNEDGAIVGLV